MDSFFSQMLTGKLGWKSVAGAAIIFIAVIGEAFGWIEPGASEKLIHAGEILGIVGIRHAINKVKEQ